MFHRPDNVPDLRSTIFLKIAEKMIAWQRKRGRGNVARMEVSREMAFAMLRRSTGRSLIPLCLSSIWLKKVRNIGIPAQSGALPARVFVPYGAKGDFILFLHGGGFVHCDLNSHHGICCVIARHAKTTVVSLNYRLAPENKFPAGHEDAWVALQWLMQRAEESGGHVAVAGDSAGGTLAAYLTHRMRDAAREESEKIHTPLAAQLLFYPALMGDRKLPSRIRYAQGPVLTRSLLEWYAAQVLNTPAEVEDIRFSPGLSEDLSDLPPGVVIAAACDPLRDDAVLYADALQQAGVRCDLMVMKGMLHGSLNFYALLPEVRKSMKAGARFLQKAFQEKRRQKLPDESIRKL